MHSRIRSGIHQAQWCNLTREVFLEVLKLESKLERKITIVQMDRLVILYSELIEHYNMKHDPIQIYFVEKMKNSLAKTKAFQLYYAQNVPNDELQYRTSFERESQKNILWNEWNGKGGDKQDANGQFNQQDAPKNKRKISKQLKYQHQSKNSTSSYADSNSGQQDNILAEDLFSFDGANYSKQSYLAQTPPKQSMLQDEYPAFEDKILNKSSTLKTERGSSCQVGFINNASKANSNHTNSKFISNSSSKADKDRFYDPEKMQNERNMKLYMFREVLQKQSNKQSEVKTIIQDYERISKKKDTLVKTDIDNQMSKIHERIKAKRESSMKKSLTTELLASPSQAIRNISNNTNLFFQSLSMASQSPRQDREVSPNSKKHQMQSEFCANGLNFRLHHAQSLYCFQNNCQEEEQQCPPRKIQYNGSAFDVGHGEDKLNDPNKGENIVCHKISQLEIECQDQPIIELSREEVSYAEQQSYE